VTNITDYGAFVELEPGVEGLVHVSEMSWTKKNVHPGKIVSTSQEVEVMVLEIDSAKRRVSLGLKQTMRNPWEVFAETHPEGTEVEGEVRGITEFGLFIGLGPELDGMVHINDISWDVPGEQAIANFNKGDQVRAKVLDVDTDKERISLGIKQLDQDPFATYLAQHSRGEIVTATVQGVEPRGAVVVLDDAVEAYLPASELARERVEDARSVLNEGDRIEVRIVGVDRRSRNLTVSVKAKEMKEERAAMEEYQQQADSAPATTLGDLLKEQMRRDS